MKNTLLKFAIPAIAALSFFACKPDKTTPPVEYPVLSIVPSATTVTFAAVGGDRKIEIVTNREQWDATLTPADGNGWLTHKKDGNVLTLTAGENTKLREQDPVTVTITAGDAAPVVLSVKQEAFSPDPTLVTNPASEMSFEAIGHELFVYVTTNQGSYEVSLLPADGGGWLTMSRKEDDSFALRAAANPKPTARGPVTITVSAGDAQPVVIGVTQQAATPQLSLDPSGTMTFLADGGTNTVQVTTNYDTWDVVLSPADGHGWLTVTKQSGSFTLTATENTLTSEPEPVTVTVSAGDATPATITVKQDAADAPLVYYKVGDYWPDEDNSEGIVWYIDPGSSTDGGVTGLHGKIVALDTPDVKVLWTSMNLYDLPSLSREDGQANTAAIVKYAQDNVFTLDPLGAVQRCLDKGEGWYMPAFNEHRRLYAVMSGTTFEDANANRPNPEWDPQDATQQDDEAWMPNYVPEFLSTGWTDYSAMPDKISVWQEQWNGEMGWSLTSDPKYKAARDAFNAKFTAKGGQALYNAYIYWWSSTPVETSPSQQSWAFGSPVGTGSAQSRGTSPGGYVRAMKVF